MKKLASLLLSVCFLVGLNGNALAATKTTTKKPVVKPVELKATGVIKNYNSKSVVINVAGKDTTFQLTASTKVTQYGDSVLFADVVRKGLKVSFKYMSNNNALTAIEIPGFGSENQGDLKLKSVDINVALTDSTIPVSAPKVTPSFFSSSRSQVREAAGEEESDSYVFSNDPDSGYGSGLDVVDLGLIDVVPESIKITLDGKEIKVLTDAKAEFDNKVVGDEAKFFVNEDGIAQIKFEVKLYEDAKNYTIEDLEKRLQISFKKKMYKITTYEITDFPFSEDVVCELNGKPVSLAKALNRSNYSNFTTNLDGEIIYVDAFYKALTCKVVSIKGNAITIAKLVNDADPASQVKWTETLTLSTGLTVQDSNGTPISLENVKAGDMIKVTVEAADGYKVNLIEKIVK